MISKKLKSILLISVIVFIVHEIEEWLTSFWNIDTLTLSVAEYFDNIPQAIFITWNLTLVLSLIAIVLLIQGGKSALVVLTIPGLIFIFELTHIIKSLMLRGYYPGLYTSFAFPIIGFFYWRELIKNWKQN